MNQRHISIIEKYTEGTKIQLSKFQLLEEGNQEDKNAKLGFTVEMPYEYPLHYPNL